MNEQPESVCRETSFGANGKLTIVDKFGIWLSRRAILREISGRKNLDVLELGCGYAANNLLAISDRAKRLVGVDLKLDDRLKSNEQFTAIESTIDESLVQLENQSFDLIMIVSVLEHLVNPVDVLRKCFNLLKPGGVLLINVPTWRGKFFLEYSAFRLKLSPQEEMDDHKMYYDKRDLWPLIIKAGFMPSLTKLRYHKFRLNLFSVSKKPSAARSIDTNQDDWSEHWSSYADSASSNPAQLMRHQLIIGEAKKLSHHQSLLVDIGSGQGDFIAKAVDASLAHRYVGFELSETGVKISQSKVPGAEFFQVDLFDPPSSADVFRKQVDIAICSDVIEHVDHPVIFCQQVKQFLKPNGKLILTVPGGPMSAFDKHIGHRTHYNRRTVTHVLEQAGYAVDKVMMAGFPFFNLYRLVVILRGKQLIQDVESTEDKATIGKLARVVMYLFKGLFLFNIKNSTWGWQVVAVATPKSNTDKDTT
ncbi:MAG: methyltransferase domain-containing protein [Coxiellaceae bacterium]|nr:methyltransferase domain-containing protein [Coxiellaceae bacterium]